MLAPFVALNRQKKRSGGGPLLAPPPVGLMCPEVGSGAGQLVYWADAVSTFPLPSAPDWSSTPGSADAFDANDGVGWVWVYDSEHASGVQSGISGTATIDAACPITVTGGQIDAYYIDAVDAGLWVVATDAVTDYASTSPTAYSGDGVITLTLTAAQAAGFLAGGGWYTGIGFDPSSESGQVGWDAVSWTIDYIA